MIGPFGGVTAAQALNAVLHPQRLGEPIAFTVNFAAALSDGVLQCTAAGANQPFNPALDVVRWTSHRSPRWPPMYSSRASGAGVPR
jgi:hypothetical protein